MLIFIGLAGLIGLLMAGRILSVCLDPRADAALASGWWIAPTFALSVCLILWVLT